MSSSNGAQSMSTFVGFQSPKGGRGFSESPKMSSNDWDEDFGFRTPDSPSWNRTNYRTSRSKKFNSTRSAPLLDAAHSTHTSTWYTSSAFRRTSTRESPMWKPLGSTWRDWDKDDFGSPIRKNADQGNDFLHGTIPKWNKGQSMRKIHVLEHELTWAYYRMRRHTEHPLREEVGDPHLPPECVVEKMRHGSENKFQFWRDLKPPFIISNAKRQTNEPEAGHHPDGDLFHVQYHCGIDYVSERLWNDKSDGGTFDNKIHAIAQVRIPDGFPRGGKPITIVSWGNPSLIWEPTIQEQDEGDKPLFVDPNKWMPISDELGLRADAQRFAACREATRKAASHRPVEMPPLQKLLLGPHSSSAVAKTAVALGQKEHAKSCSPTRKAGSTPGSAEGASPTSPKNRRQHRIFTAAAGFVRYVG